MDSFDLSLYLVTDDSLSKGRSVEWIVEQAVLGGVTMVQLREKNITTLDFLEKAIALKKILTPYGIPLIINDRLDIALAADADGLHIGQSDMPYAIAREMLGYDKIIGLSVETIEQAKDANLWDVDYIGLSPVFSTNTKTDINTPLGLEGIERIASFSRHPMVAIGGINVKNTPSILKAGAHGVAVVSAIVAADDVKGAAAAFKKVIQS